MSKTRSIKALVITAVVLTAMFRSAASAGATGIYATNYVGEQYGKLMCLEANGGGSAYNGDRVQLWGCWLGPNQTWVFSGGWPGANGAAQYLPFRNTAHGLCLDANAQASGSNGDRVQLWSCTGGANQAWSPRNCFSKVVGTPYGVGLEYFCEMVNAAHHLCLDANGGGALNNGDTVMLWSCWRGANQYWRMPYATGLVGY